MKRMISIAGIIAGAFMIISAVAPMIVGAILRLQLTDSVGIIGGADGPTAIIVTGFLGMGSVIIQLLLGVICLAAGIWGYIICRKR